MRFLTQETDPNEVAVYRKMIADFEAKNPDTKIELQLTGPDQIIERMVAALSAGVTTLDMLQPNPAMGFMLASKDALLPIDDIVTKLGGDGFFYDNSVMKWNDKRYGVPFGGGAGVIWYRKDLLRSGRNQGAHHLAGVRRGLQALHQEVQPELAHRDRHHPAVLHAPVHVCSSVRRSSGPPAPRSSTRT